MLSPKEATQKAILIARDLYEGENLQFLRLEEIELSDDGRSWEVTLGWVEPAARTHKPFLLGFESTEILALPRVYKIFKMDAESGAFLGMTLRVVK